MIGSYTASFLPIIFVPLSGLVMPAVVMGLLFNYIQSED